MRDQGGRRLSDEETRNVYLSLIGKRVRVTIKKQPAWSCSHVVFMGVLRMGDVYGFVFEVNGKTFIMQPKIVTSIGEI